MKARSLRNSSGVGQAGLRAFTLTELMVSSALVTILVAGVITCHLFGLKMLGISQTVVGGTDASRRATGLLMEDIRSAKSLLVGQGNASSFTEIAACTLQQGNAIQIYTNAGTANYIRYYVDPDTTNLVRVTSGGGAQETVASSLVSNNVFTCEDYQGNIASNRQSSFVLGVYLDFSQLGTPAVLFGTNASVYYYNSFAVQLKMCSRSPD